MNLEQATQENLEYILTGLAKCLDVANKGLLHADDYDIKKYDELKMMYEILSNRPKLSPTEADAFISELSTTRKK